MQTTGGMSVIGGFTVIPGAGGGAGGGGGGALGGTYSTTTLWNNLYSYSSKSVNGGANSTLLSAYSADGTKVYLGGGVSYATVIRQYTLSTAWDLSTATYANKSFDYGVGAYGYEFSADGSYFYITTGSRVRQYTMSTPWDISSATYTKESISLSSVSPVSGSVAADGTSFFFGDSVNKTVRKLSLSTAWDITSATLDGTALSWTAAPVNAGAFTCAPTAVVVTRDGLNMLVALDSNGSTAAYQTGRVVLVYTMSPAYNLSTAAYVRARTLSAGSSITSMYLGDRATKLITSGTQADITYQYGNGL